MTNVLLITADQWRGDCLSAAGHPHVRTPNIDALAAEGVRFRRHYANATPCAPARASLYTGLYQMNHRVVANGTPLDARHDNIARAARRAGYVPVLFGHTDAAVDPRYYKPGDPELRTYEGVLPGFDTDLAMTEDEPEWREWLAADGVELPKTHPHRGVDGVDDPPRGQPPVYRAEQTPTAFVIDRVCDWLDTRVDSGIDDGADRQTGATFDSPGDKPGHAPRSTTNPGWFAHVSLLRPHPPFVAPPPYDRWVEPDALATLSAAGDWRMSATPHAYTELVGRTQQKGTFIAGAEGLVRDWTVRDLQQIAATYFGMVSEVDAQIGRLFEHLKRIGQWDDTLVIVTSDHGEMLGDHGLLGKGGYHDGSYHIPLIVRDPLHGAASGRVVDAMTEAVDVMPTLLERLGLPVSSTLDGRSLQAWIQGDTPAWRSAVHWEFDFRDIPERLTERALGLDSCHCHLAVHREADLKYVHFAGLPSLLFDLREDPMETRDVAGSADYRDRRLGAAEAMLSWRGAHLDQTLALTRLTRDGPMRVPRR